MSTIEGILNDTPLPDFVEARQKFDSAHLDEEGIRRRIREQTGENSYFENIPSEARVAITAGSRGIRHIDVVLNELVRILKGRNLRPFIVAAMGSHGGDPEGRRAILSHLGIRENRVGAPIVASEELTEVGRAADGRTVYADTFAFESDAVVVVNRIKSHTAFHAPVESGLQKMLAIGLGKQRGADSCHVRGFDGMYENVTEFASVILEKMKVPFGIGILENAYGEVYDCIVVPGAEIKTREPELLSVARTRLPKLLLDDIDVLIVTEMGKDISGSGMDTNVIGRYPTPHITGGPKIAKIAVLDLTPGSEGSAHGVGFADFISQGLFEKIDRDKTYPNCLTNKVVAPAKIPPIMPNDRLAVKAAVKTCPTVDPERIRAVWIKNTHDLEYIYISKALIGEAESLSNMEILGGPVGGESLFVENRRKEDLWKRHGTEKT